MPPRATWPARPAASRGRRRKSCGRWGRGGCWRDSLKEERGRGYKMRSVECGMRNCTGGSIRSEEYTSELQSQSNLVCRLLLEKKIKTHLLSNDRWLCAQDRIAQWLYHLATHSLTISR